ncbi:MAG: acyl-CoA ligase (AMP-forming), exosortase system-associated [Sphingomonas bacterium]|nr:acyl-CoA ligase (AMP-forming), exosortase system-associated [Sphingomonas bacterium]
MDAPPVVLQESAMPLDDRPRPLDHLALCGAAADSALEDGEGVLDYAALDQAVGTLAAALLGRGLEPGDRVASWLPKTRLACLLPLGCARAGLVHVPINPLLKRAQVAHILADSGAALLIAGEARAETLEPGDLAGAALIVAERDGPALLAGDAALPSSAHDPDRLAALLYTSGSTGRPKGVMLSHANLWLGAVSVASYLRLSSDDRTLCVLPLSFDYGQNQLFSTWAAGGCAVPIDYLVARDVVRAVEQRAITTLAGVPPLWLQLAEATWPAAATAGIRRITNSGGRLAEPLVRRLRALLPEADLYSMYGLTEAFRSTYLDPGLIDAHPDSIGRAIPFAEVMVVRPDGTAAAPDEPGELVHAGPLVAQGYWRDPARTSERFRPAPSFSRYPGVGVWSGDTVVEGADGLLRFVGRDDEMIKVSGNRLSPQEIEDAAMASGAVREAVAMGVPDEAAGEAVLLVAQAADGIDHPDRLLAAYLRRTLPGFMQPRQVLWRDRLPTGPNGKLDRAAIRAEFRR